MNININFVQALAPQRRRLEGWVQGQAPPQAAVMVAAGPAAPANRLQRAPASWITVPQVPV